MPIFHTSRARPLAGAFSALAILTALSVAPASATPAECGDLLLFDVRGSFLSDPLSYPSLTSALAFAPARALDYIASCYNFPRVFSYADPVPVREAEYQQVEVRIVNSASAMGDSQM